MKVDIVTDTFRPAVNGVAMTLGHLADGLRERGHEVHVIHTGKTPGAGETLAAAVPLPGYGEVRIGLPKPFALRGRWRRERPDAVYVATESPLGKSALRAARALRIPVVAGFHTNFQDYAAKYRVGVLQPVAAAYLREFHRLADCTITPSPDVRDRLVAEGFGHVRLLGRGVDAGMFQPDRRSCALRAGWGARPGTPVALLAGRLAAEKNLELAFATFERMRRDVPDFRAVVVGDGPLRARCQARHPWVHFAGMLTGEDLARHYASADVLLFPSETETFGNVLLEAMASGLATVSFDYAAAALHVRHGENGFKAARGDSASFMALAVAALGLKPGDPLRAAARETAARLGWPAVVAQFESHLADLVGPRAGDRPAPRPPGKRTKLSCRTVFLSDLHLGTPDSKADEVVEFLKHLECDKLVLNGDIIDAWALKRGGKWSSRHTRVIRKILKLTERIHYLNSGDWVESLTAIIEHHDGRMELVRYHEFVGRMRSDGAPPAGAQCGQPGAVSAPGPQSDSPALGGRFSGSGAP